MEIAKFLLQDYQFTKVFFDLTKKGVDDGRLNIKPSGVYFTQTSSFELKFTFQAFNNGDTSPFLEIVCVSTFKFENAESLKDIP
jgi:hypothetical protein